MFFNGLGTATPSRCFTKSECWDAFRRSDWFDRLDQRARAIAQAVLSWENGIETRHLAVTSLEETFEIDPDRLHQRFLRHAPALASQAARLALDDAELAPSQIDAVIVSTCTGYLCPGLSGFVLDNLGLAPTVLAFDLVGQGCAAALPNLQMAQALLMSRNCRHVLSVCVEVCSAAMYLDNDPGVMISACLFGDGAGAAVLSAVDPQRPRRIEWRCSGSLIDPAQRSALMFEQRGGLLRNRLSRQVPALAGMHARQVFDNVAGAKGLTPRDIRAWILHAGGRDVLASLQRNFGMPADALGYSSSVLRSRGNLSSAFVYFVLQAALEDHAEGGWWWLSSFGAGFSCHGALLEVT